MKKQIKKKLTVSKITISNLNSEELGKLHGGTLVKSEYCFPLTHLLSECIPCPATYEPCPSKDCIPTS